MGHSKQTFHLGAINTFCKAAELGQFSHAAEALGITPAAVSRTIARLEAIHGVRLFARSTRKVRLTEEGRRYFERCRDALIQLAEAERELTGTQAEPSGLLRVSVPTTYGHYRLLPLIPSFEKLYPMIRLELSISNRNVDFIDEGFDLAIRLGEPKDSRLIARTLEHAPLGIFASPGYLREFGIPRTLNDLERHRRIQFVLPSTGRPMPWLLLQHGRVVEYDFGSSTQVLDDVLGGVTLAAAGGGLFQIYRFVAHGHPGELTEVMKSAAGASRPFCILYPANRQVSARQRVFIDHLVAHIGGIQKSTERP